MSSRNVARPTSLEMETSVISAEQPTQLIPEEQPTQVIPDIEGPIDCLMPEHLEVRETPTRDESNQIEWVSGWNNHLSSYTGLRDIFVIPSRWPSKQNKGQEYQLILECVTTYPNKMAKWVYFNMGTDGPMAELEPLQPVSRPSVFNRFKRVVVTKPADV